MFRQISLPMIAMILTALITTACQSAAPPFECTDAIGCVDIAPGEPIKLGVLQALTGRAAPNGAEQMRNIELAVAQRDGQLLGYPITLLSEDEQCLPEGGTTATLKLVADPEIVAILGPTCSAAAATAAEVMTMAGLTMISGQAGAADLTGTDGVPGSNWRPGFFRTIYNTSLRGRSAAAFSFFELGLTKVALVNDGDLFTKGNTDSFSQSFSEFGGEVVAEITVNRGDTDMRPALTAIVNAGAEVVYFSLFQPEGVPLVQQTDEVEGMSDVIFISGSQLTDAFIEAIGSDGVGLYFSSPPALEGTANDDLLAAYSEHFNQVPATAFYGYSYDATNLLLDTIEMVAVQDEDGSLHIGRQILRDALVATIDYDGVTGQLSCTQFGDCGVSSFVIIRLDDPTAGVEGLISNVIYTYTPPD